MYYDNESALHWFQIVNHKTIFRLKWELDNEWVIGAVVPSSLNDHAQNISRRGTASYDNEFILINGQNTLHARRDK